MAYEWDDDMGSISPVPEHEEVMRQAVKAGIEAALGVGGDPPALRGGRVVTGAANERGTALLAAVEAALEDTDVAPQHYRGLVTVAARAAAHVVYAGGGQEGFLALGRAIAAGRRARGQGLARGRARPGAGPG